VGKEGRIVGAQEKFNKKIGIKKFPWIKPVFNYFSFFRVEFQCA
jgi:hypothetical protein